MGESMSVAVSSVEMARKTRAAPYALLLVLVSIPATVLLMRTDSPATQTEKVPA